MIRKTNGYTVYSEKGKKLGGPYRTKSQAVKRLRQVEYFKRKKGPHSPTSWAYSNIGIQKLIKEVS